MEKRIERDRIVAVIQAEQKLIEGFYIEETKCENPGHCALGALLFAVGVTNNELYANYIGEPSEWHDESEWIAEKMFDAYGLRRLHCMAIMQANDNGTVGEERTELRRAVVIECVHSLAAAQLQNPTADWERCTKYDDREQHADSD